MVIGTRLGMMSAALLIGAVLVLGQEPTTQPRQTAQKAQKTTSPTKNQQSEGERKFQINCGRCHNPPEQLSSRIAGSVIRHMRVRAMLSQEDAREILQYLAP
jgi:mono/diheme cytochrome c family protein